ncbi:hypothetical protein RAD16_03405 [Bradyrhizobium sp. 18BD]
MDKNIPKFSDATAGAAMRPQYMGRTVTTYPVSESEMEHISSLNDQVTTRFSLASFHAALAAGIWTNAAFATEMSSLAYLFTYFVAPFLLANAIGWIIAGFIARSKKASAWEKIKREAEPMQTFAQAAGLVLTGHTPRRGGR